MDKLIMNYLHRIKTNICFNSARRIAFLWNNPSREERIINLVGDELKKRDIDCIGMGLLDHDLLFKLLKFKPDTIVTFPITTRMQVYLLKMIKFLFKCCIVTYVTEGKIDYFDKQAVKNCVGYYSYPSNLIDYHIFWGIVAQKVVGRELIKHGYAKNSKNMAYCGYPNYEKEKIRKFKLPIKLENIVNDYASKCILVLTGFSFSEYTVRDIFRAQDLIDEKGDLRKQVKYWKDIIEQERIYCDNYIEMIKGTAKQNKDFLFLVKLHPHEIIDRKAKKCKYINKLLEEKNIMIIEEKIQIGDLLPKCSLMIHYGSTAAYEAYVHKIPSVLIRKENLIISKIIGYSESILEKNSIDKYLQKIREGKDLFLQSEKLENELYELFNYKTDENYNPSEQIAEIIANKVNFHKIKVSDFSKQDMIDIKNYILKKICKIC